MARTKRRVMGTRVAARLNARAARIATLPPEEPKGSADAATSTVAPASTPQAVTSNLSLCFLDLPDELQVHILRDVLPHGQVFHILRSGSILGSGVETTPYGFPSERSYHYIPKAILTTNRAIASKALEILYGENTFHFYISRTITDDGSVFHNTFLPFLEDRKAPSSHPSALAYLKNIGFAITDMLLTHHAVYKRVRRTLTQIVEKLNERNHTIKSVKLTLCDNPWGGMARYQHVLEPFADLRDIGRVTIDGDVSGVFPDQLVAVMRGECEKPKTIQYGKHKVWRRKPGLHWDPMGTKTVLKRKFYDPELDWNGEMIGREAKKAREDEMGGKR